MMPIMLRGAVPVFVNVTGCEMLVVPTVWVGKLRLDGDSVTGELPEVVKLQIGPIVVPVELLAVAYHS